jgi:hypothetical protein
MCAMNGKQLSWEERPEVNLWSQSACAIRIPFLAPPRARGFKGAQNIVNDCIDPKRCPLCGGANDCAVAQGRGNCWCFTRAIPEDVLARIPPEAQERACVCSACAFGSHDPASKLQRMTEILRRRNGLS